MYGVLGDKGVRELCDIIFREYEAAKIAHNNKPDDKEIESLSIFLF